MINFVHRIIMTSSLAMLGTLSLVSIPAFAENKIKFTLATSASKTDQRSIAIAEVFAPMIAKFANYKAAYNSSLFSQGTELEAISRGNLTMSITSAQEIAQFFPEFSIFATAYVHQNAEHQVSVFNDQLMTPFKKKIEDELGVKLLSVMYLGRRHINLRMPRSELNIKIPIDLKGVNLRMPGTDSWQFLGAALGASPTPMAFSEVYTALSTGAIDGQDNPLPTIVDQKFYEVTKQIVLTSHLVDLNYIAFSKEVWDELTAEQQIIVQRAADAASESGRLKQLKEEKELLDFISNQGVEIYSPNLLAFRKHVQVQYVESDMAQSWPEGVLDRINYLGK